ncbi:hypothetical protein EDB83DRAFT_2535836 [Lactarius deliciosus]|nr:hypothetical protein EDB83DRAFT_2535836 [Lactarius deliciosus]
MSSSAHPRHRYYDSEPPSDHQATVIRRRRHSLPTPPLRYLVTLPPSHHCIWQSRSPRSSPHHHVSPPSRFLPTRVIALEQAALLAMTSHRRAHTAPPTMSPRPSLTSPHVTITSRRGPLQPALTTKQLRELTALDSTTVPPLAPRPTHANDPISR